MVVCVTVLLFFLFLWLSLSFPLSTPVLFCQAEDDLVLLAAIPLAVLDSTLCWWISYVSPMLLVCVPLSLLLGCLTVALCMSAVNRPFLSSFPLWFPRFSPFIKLDSPKGQTHPCYSQWVRKTLYSSLSFLFCFNCIVSCVWFRLWTSGSCWALVIRYSPWHSVTSSLAWPRRWSSFGWGETWSSCPCTDTSPTHSYSLSSVSLWH